MKIDLARERYELARRKADFEDGIEEENIKKLLKYLPDEALLVDETIASMDDITKKGEIVLNKEGYIVVRQKNNQHDFFVYIIEK